MSLISDYTFNNMDRMGNDMVCQDQNTIQNSLSASYLLQNYHKNDGLMNTQVRFATQQPCVFYNGTYSTSPGGLNVDDSSKLLIGSLQTHPKCHISLQQRLFATVPYLGRGSVCSNIESQIMQGEMIPNKKSVNNVTEKSYLNYHMTPLLPHIQSSMSNEESVNPNIVRGGITTRDMNKDVQFYKPTI